MAQNVADLMWKMLEKAGVKRCYGIIGDALNPVIDALRRNGNIEFVHVRHEEYGVFAAGAEAYFTGEPVAVCGTAGPGVTHLINGLIDALKEGAPVIAIAGDVETSIMDTAGLEELNPYLFFETASLYTGRVVNPKQARAVINTAIMTAVPRARADRDFDAGRCGERGCGFSHRGREDTGRTGFPSRGCRHRQAGANDRCSKDRGNLWGRRLPRCPQ